MTPFQRMCKTFAGLNVFKEPDPAIEEKEARANTYAWRKLDYVHLRENVQAASPYMPSRYQNEFVAKIVATKDDLTERAEARLQAIFGPGYARDELRPAVADWVERLEFAATGWQPGDGNQGDTRKVFQHLYFVVSEFFDNVTLEVSKQLTPEKGEKLRQLLPPLVTLSPTRLWGPRTMNGADVEEICGANVPIVTLPWVYAKHPVLWTILSHEVGGHDVMHALGSHTCGAGAIDGLTGEIAESFEKVPGAIPPEWVSTWQAWAEEAIADVFGMLTIGPSFTVNLCAWLSAAKAHDLYGPAVELGTLSGTIHTRYGTIVGQHPPDLLRLHLAIGVLEALGQSNVGGWTYWRDALNAIVADVAHGPNVLTVYETSSNSTTLQYDASEACNIARRVGAHIVNTPFVTIGGKTLSHILKWTEEDNNIANDISVIVAQGAAGAGNTPPGSTSPKLLAGVTMALYQNATTYEQATAFLHAEINHRVNPPGI